MAKWRKVINGDKLRKSIDENTSGDTIREISAIYDKIKTFTKDEDELYTVDNLQSLLEGMAEQIDMEDFNILEDYGEDTYEDIVNLQLTDLWDFCDKYRYFIDL